MIKRFILLKLHHNEIRFKTYDTLDELKRGYEHTDEFPGEVSAEYDLDTESFIDMKDPHGEGSILRPTIDALKAKYKCKE